MDSQKPQRCLTESRLQKLYEQALAIISEYVETELSRDTDQPARETRKNEKQKGKVNLWNMLYLNNRL